MRRGFFLALVLLLAGCPDDPGSSSATSASATAAKPIVANISFHRATKPVKSALIQRAGDGVYYLFVSSRAISCAEAPSLASNDAKAASDKRRELGVPIAADSIDMRAALVDDERKGYFVTRAHFGLAEGDKYQLSQISLPHRIPLGEVTPNQPLAINIESAQGALGGTILPELCAGEHVHPGTANPQPDLSVTVDGKPVSLRDATFTVQPHKKSVDNKLYLSTEPLGCGTDPVRRFVPLGLSLEWVDGAEDHIEIDVMTIGQSGYATAWIPKASVKRDGDVFEVSADVKQHGKHIVVSGKVKPTICTPPK